MKNVLKILGEGNKGNRHGKRTMEVDGVQESEVFFTRSAITEQIFY